MKFEFKEIGNDGSQRAKVIGGWIVKTFDSVTHITEDRGITEGYDWRIAIAFVPDKDHEWVVEE